jgi:hypothetical protein
MNARERADRRMSLSRHYMAAPLGSFDPPAGQFHVITARKEGERAVTEAWLGRYYGGRVLSVHMLSESRTFENVTRFKADTLARLQVTEFTEDNLKICKWLAAALPWLRVFYWDGGAASLVHVGC